MKTRTSIKFGLIDVTAKSDSQLLVNDKQNFIDLNDLKKEELEEIKYRHMWEKSIRSRWNIWINAWSSRFSKYGVVE